MASHDFPVAVIGMTVKLPGAKNCEAFWDLMVKQGDTVSTFPPERAADVEHVLPAFKGQFVDESSPFFTGSFFKSVDNFDADLFGVNPKEALFIEPEQRMFLETVWELLEDAGYASKIRNSNTGVYVGNTVNKYKYILTENHPSISHGNHSPFISSRVSYTLNLSGPAMMVATGCSSSLLAVHLACQGLLSGDCDMAIAGGITLDLLPISLKTDIWNQLGITSPNAKCRAFDANAKGIAKAEGCGIVLLKPLEKAIADGDNIYGVLEATTANQDGHSQGITAPHPGAQSNMLVKAWELADITPDCLGYIEAHGTGTELGDPIEIMGITKAYQKMAKVPTSKKIPIGSVKANIGHLADGAAGVVSLIKVLLCMNKRRIPPVTNFSSPNPHINWEKAPVEVNETLREWENDGSQSRYGGVSAFGLLGTNIHAVVKEYKPKASVNLSLEPSKPQLLCLASKTKQSLMAFVKSLSNFVEGRTDMSHEEFTRLCYTLNTGREQNRFPNRLAVVSSNPTDMANALQSCTSCSEGQYVRQRIATLDPTPKQASIIDRFLNGNSVDWKYFYVDTHHTLKTPLGMLPTYVFERTRYWPEVSNTLNKQYLLLEHQIPMDNESGTAVDQTNTETDTQCRNTNDNIDVFQVLSETFNNALGNTYDWLEKGDTNLFELGVDSLVYTHLAMHLMKLFDTKQNVMFTQADLHSRPTFNELCEFLKEKLHAERPTSSTVSLTISGERNAFGIDEKIPLLFSQRRLWVIEKMEKAGSTYNATNCVKITGKLDVEAFKRSVNTALKMHDAFFVTIQETNAEPSIVHNWSADIEMEEIEVDSRFTSPEETAMKSYEADYKAPFTLTKGPLVRTKLYILGGDQYLFTMVIHHIIFDGWSHFVLYNEIWDNYKQSIEGHTLSTEMKKPMSSIFSKLEQEQTSTKQSRLQKDMDYWLKQLSSPLPLSTFPGDRKRPETFTYEGGRLTRFIDIGIFKKLNKSSQDSHTMFHSILASVFVLMKHFNPAQTDFIVGIPVTGRHVIEMKDVIGCFINTLVIRVSLNKTNTFFEILQSVVNTCLEAQDHQLAPFDHLVSKLKLPRNTSITPVFSVNVCYHNEELSHGHVDPPDELVIERKLLHNGTSKWDVQFDFLEEGNQMRFTLEYYKGIFSDSYANLIADMFIQTMEVLTQSPDSPLARASIGKASIIAGPKVILGDRSLSHKLIESLGIHQNSVIRDETGHMYTYRDLKRGSSRIATFMKKTCRLKKGDSVGLLFENSYEGLQVIVACLMAGIVYVPLNPDHPKARLEEIVRSSRIKLVCFAKDTFSTASYLQWACKEMGNIFCINGEHLTEVTETHENPLMDIELWNCVAEDSTSDIEGGGWKSSFTGEHMCIQEMNDYVNNVVEKLEKHIDAETKVLEIGCASGLTTQALCSKVKIYVATDMSETMVKKLQEKNLENIQAHCAPAHAIADMFEDIKFDLIIINSVVHCFPGYNYLRKVLQASANLLAPNGKIFVGDVMDLKKKDDLEHALKSFKASNPNYRTKTDLSAELFVPAEFFESFQELFPTVNISPKLWTVENELTRYRYDVLMTKGDRNDSIQQTIEKQIFSVNDLDHDVYGIQEVSVNLNDDAYIIFTSGTTGTPKGVRISQKALLNYCSWATSEYSLDTKSRMPLFSPLTFDFTVTSMIPPLLHGSTIEIFRPFADSYEDMAASTTLTVAKFSPLQLDTILTSAVKPLNIDRYIIGGEEMTYTLLKKLKENREDKPFKVWNEYGPTEATVGCVVKCIDSTEIKDFEDQYIPIGKPINNVTVAVVESDKPVTIGTQGYLAIGGPCLTSGFLHSRKSNDNSFSSACWSQDGSLMYTTTDVVSCNVDKEDILYFGRDSADITKINEIRVDISEVQASIRKVALVEKAWVCRFDLDGSAFLGAAIKLVNNAVYTDEDLKNAITKDLAQRLPLYCIPKIIVQLTEPPTNRNGKKDTALLKRLFIDEMGKSTTHDSCLPNETERKVQKIWQEILPINRLPGLNEDFFFELSGDSLQAIHLVRKMRNAGFSLTINDIFKTPTIKSLCKSLGTNQVEDIKPKQTCGTDKPFRPTPIAEKYMLAKRKSDRFAVPALLELRTPLKVDVIKKALQAVMLKHNSLSSRFFTENGQVFQQYVDIENKPTVIETLLSNDSQKIVEDPVFIKTCNDLETQLDIGRGNLLNAAVFRSDTKHYCLIVIHHISVDIVSWQQLLEDLSLALEQLKSGEFTALSPAAAPFHVYCEELWKEGKHCPQDEIEYWKKVTEAYRNKDVFQKETELSFYGNAKWESQAVDADTVRQLSIAIGGTDESVILTALGKSFMKLTGSHLTVCLESHGRQLHLDTTDTVGWCTSMFPFTIHTNPEDDFIRATNKVKNDIKQIPLHGVRYGPAVGVGKVNSELPNTMFVFQGSLDASSKVEFKAGDASFRYLPWVEVLTHDLENGHYHRDDNDLLDFPLEVICWFHSNYLRIGSLFDSKKVTSEWVQSLLDDMKNIILDQSRKLDPLAVDIKLDTLREGARKKAAYIDSCTPEEITESKETRSIQVLANIMIDPKVLSFTKDVLSSQGFPNIDFVLKEPSEFYPCLLDGEAALERISVAIVYCTHVQHRNEIQKALQSFLAKNQGTENKLIIIELANNTHLIPLNLERERDFKIHTVLFEDDEWDNSLAADYNMPLTQRGYSVLALSLARAMAGCLKMTQMKVICVDGDYTLWDGECANTDVNVTEANVTFQTFLLQKMHEGYLLVLLSKNRHDDVLAMLEKAEMILKKEHFVHLAVNWQPKHLNISRVSDLLDLNLQSFVFIDDNVSECEEMLIAHPQVKTLRIPTDPNLIKAFTSSLWFLDIIDTTNEASNRTELYRQEVSRLTGNISLKPDKNATHEAFDMSSLLLSWGMKMCIWKSSIRDLHSNPKVSKRVSELLHRTNQFKLNDSQVKIEDFCDEDECLVVSLEDRYGKYGIISVIVIEKGTRNETVKQWVLSCRALGRNVEERLIYELFNNTKYYNTSTCFRFKKTEKNIPMQTFIQRFTKCSAFTSTADFILDKDSVRNMDEILKLHEVYITDDPSSLLLPESQFNVSSGQYQRCDVSSNIANQLALSRWLRSNLSNKHMDHIVRHTTLPMFLLHGDVRIFEEIGHQTQRGDITLEQLWMQTLKIQQKPDDDDNFVKQGGSSFQAVFLISEIQATFGVKLELIDVLTKSLSWLKKQIQGNVELNHSDQNSKCCSGRIELSQAQRRMWMIQTSSEGSTAYTESIALRIGKHIPIDELVYHLIKKHPILMAMLDSSASYLHMHDDTVNIKEHEVKSFEDLKKCISASKPVFGKTEEPLVRFIEYKCEDARVFVIHIHHILIDDITLHNIKQTVMRVTEIPSLGSKGNAAKTEESLADDDIEACVNSEKKYMASNSFRTDKLFWENKFIDCPEETSFGLKPNMEISEFVPQTAEIVKVDVTNEALKQIKNRLHEYGVTEFQYILACFLIVVQRYTGNDDVLLAIPVSTRRSETKDTDGLFVNTVLFRYRVSLDQTFEEHIKRVASEWLESLSHSMYPVNYVGQTLWEQFGTSLSSISKVMFNFATFEVEGVDVPVKPTHAKMPFSVDIVRDQEEMSLICEYSKEWVDESTAKYVLGALNNVIDAGKVDMQTQLRDIEFLTDDELERIGSLSVSMSEMERDCQHVYAMFSKNAGTAPENTALAFKDTKTTYKDLMALVNVIALRIVEKTDPKMLQKNPVIIYMDKKERAIAAMFAVWKIGGFFMPLSTMYMKDISDVIESVKPCAVVVDQALYTNVENYNILNLHNEQLGSVEIPEVTTNSAADLDINRPAYIIRTSGSTGKPKNIVVSHKGLAVIAAAWTSEYKLSDFQVSLLQWAPISFDVFIGDVVRGLCCSTGKVVICPDNRRLDTEHIISLIVKEDISIVEVTPQFGLMLTKVAKRRELSSLRVFILGSDTLQKEVYDKVKRYMGPNQRLLNSYGMTEATIDSSFFEGGTMPLTHGGVVPVGRPLPGVVLKVLDPHSYLPSPVGVVGELFIGGDTVASGDVSIVVMRDGEKLLKTNDYACWLLSGDLEICGRKDTMCKLRGFRIDTSHIENTILRNCDGVTDATVAVLSHKNKGQENEYLCAFVVMESAKQDKAEILRLVKDTVRDILPYYMVPDFVELIHEIPLSQNGKVDRKRLPAIVDLVQYRWVGHKPKKVSGHITDELKQLLAESLGVETMYIDEDLTFMEQGGHSLVLMKFCSLIAERTDFKIGIVDIFSYPSLSLLTERAVKARQISITDTTTDRKEESREMNQDVCDIAICGVGLRLPNDTRSIAEFWQLLENQTNLLSSFPQQRKDDVLDCSDPELASILLEAEEFKGAFLSSIDEFDNDAFSISSTESQSMAPEQRMFLEVASETLAHGTDISEINGSNIGVFLSQAEIGYAKLNHPGEATAISGLLPGMIASRIAYNYNLKGPTMLVDTACSSGISALKAACISIQKGECNAALVGGVNLVLYPARTGVHGNNGILSPDFVCRPFDENANGTSVGEGIICFYVEPLDIALKQNKHVYGVIKSIGTNSVGKGNGITAPTPQSQEDVIRSALNDANVSPKDVSFIEAHGTGTVLGDRIELSALSTVFKRQDLNRKLPIGSVKGNLGHLDYAAGLAGLLKIIACYMFQTIPPTANFENPHKELAESVLYVATKPEPWPESEKRRFAGLSSFGLTGTNTHMIVSDAPRVAGGSSCTDAVPLLLCGASLEHIKRQAVLYKSLIHQTAVRHNINTIHEVSISIVNKLHQLLKIKLLKTRYRVAVSETDPDRILQCLSLVSQCTDETHLQSLRRQGLVFSSFPGATYEETDIPTEINAGVDAFLKYSQINPASFVKASSVNPQYCVPGVGLSIFDSKRHWLRSSVKRPRSCLGLIDILHEKIGKTRELVRTLNLTPSDELLQYEARFCCSIILNLLKETDLGEIMDNQDSITMDESFARTGMLKKYDKLFFIMIRELLNSNLVQPKGSDSSRLNLDVYSFRCQRAVLPSPKQIAEEAIAKYPQWSDCFRFPLHCSKHLKQVLWGHLSPLSVIYPQGDLNFMYQFDKLGDLLGDVYYNMYMQIIVEYAAKLSARGKTVRILEVGAGMGHVTRQLLPSLCEIPNVEYWFTDLGRAFVENAKTLFEKYTSMMRFSTFDITKNAVKQGLLGSYDIVISYNVIHTTESVYESVNNLKTCLGEDGTLFIIESAKNETWATLAWGILDGWWYFKDYDLRPYEPMLEPEKWEEVLTNAGFNSVHSCPMDAKERKHVEKFLFVCNNKQKRAEFIPAPTDGWWKCIDLTAHRHADFDTNSSCSNESGLGDEDGVSKSVVHSELKRIWCELLDLEDINDDEDFNVLGGESLLAIQMMTMVRKRIGFQLEIADTFCYTSLGSLADYISEQLEAESSDKSNIESSANSSDNELVTQTPLEAQVHVVDDDAPGCLLMFPGQGSQKVGMCRSMKDSEPAQQVFKRAEDILGYNVLDICMGHEEILSEKLESTEFVQVSLFVSCLAKISQLQYEQKDILQSVTHVAGLSVGEFAALVYANVLKFEDALVLVQRRGRAMEKEVNKASTAMASVLGPSKDSLETFLKEHIPAVVISTCLADNQHTVAGTEGDIELLIGLLSDPQISGLTIIDVRRLRVAGAFHSAYMVEAESEIKHLIDECEFRKPEVPIIMNVTGQISDDPEMIKALVSRQIVESVHWKETMVTAHEAGVRRFIEIAPARVLSSIVRNRIEKCKGCTSELIQV